MKKIARQANGKYPTALLLAIVAGLLAVSVVLAAEAGALDPTFGVNGATITDLGSTTDGVTAVALQADGKVLLSAFAQLDEVNPYHSTPLLLRYNSDGTRDTAFGTNGQIVTESGSFRGSQAAALAGGKIIVCGSLGQDIGAVRYNSNGTPDTSFGTSGVATIRFSGDSRETCSDIAIQSDGKIVLAGSEEIGNYVNFVIFRFNGNGTPDLTFNERGFYIQEFPNSRYNYGSAVAVQGDAKIVMSGTMWTNYDPGDGPWITLARFNADGTPDVTFGTNGMVTCTAAKLEAHTDALVLQPDGKIVVAGTSYGPTEDFAVARFKSNGALDATFGGTGFVTSDFGSEENGHDLALQKDGRIVVAGKQYLADPTSFMLARYNANGSLDTSFGTGGKTVSDFGGSNQSANAMVMQPDGKIVVGGSSNGDAVLARYNTVATDATRITTTFRSVGPYDGWILESTEASNLGGTLNKLATTLNVGDNQKDRQYRGLLSFNTASLPDAAVITSARLRIRRQGIVGTDPFGTHGPLVLVMRKGTFGSLGLQVKDFSTAGSTGAVQDEFSPVANNWYRADLSAANLQFIQKIGVTQFRLQFTLDDNDDMSADYIKFFSGNAATGNQPQLTITYYVP